ncbi:putative armadillo-like helical, importin beta family [Helianthus anomalus]
MIKLNQVAPTLVPLLKFFFHEEVRKAAVSAMPELLRSAKLAVEKGQSQGQNESYMKQLFVCGSLLDESRVRSIAEELKQAMTASAARRNERAERVKAEDFDTEEGEMLKEENEQEEELFDQVGDCLGTLLKTFKAPFLPYVFFFSTLQFELGLCFAQMRLLVWLIVGVEDLYTNMKDSYI